MNLAKNAIYTFKVLPSANGNEITEAIQSLYKVKVFDVRTLNTKGKAKRFGKRFGKRADWKKAYVVLEKGQKIKEFEIEEHKDKKEKKEETKTKDKVTK